MYARVIDYFPRGIINKMITPPIVGVPIFFTISKSDLLYLIKKVLNN